MNICLNCGKPMEIRTVVQLYCSKQCHLACKGKKIEINGRVFYTDGHPLDVEDGYADLTHGPSGKYVGTINSTKEKWKQVEKAMQDEYTPVEQFPPVEPMEPKKGKDGHWYRYKLPGESGKA